MDVSTIRLRALSGAPLADAKVRGVVLSTAQAIAERTGVVVEEISASDDAVTVTIAADKIAGMGFLAELRRLTNAWYAQKNQGASLWGERERHGQWGADASEGDGAGGGEWKGDPEEPDVWDGPQSDEPWDRED